MREIAPNCGCAQRKSDNNPVLLSVAAIVGGALGLLFMPLLLIACVIIGVYVVVRRTFQWLSGEIGGPNPKPRFR